MESVIVALRYGGVTLAGVIASDSKSRAVMEQKIDELTRRVEKQNCLVEHVPARARRGDPQERRRRPREKGGQG